MEIDTFNEEKREAGERAGDEDSDWAFLAASIAAPNTCMSMIINLGELHLLFGGAASTLLLVESHKSPSCQTLIHRRMCVPFMASSPINGKRHTIALHIAGFTWLYSLDGAHTDMKMTPA